VRATEHPRQQSSPYHPAGNDRQDAFFVDDDRRVYLELLAEQAGKYGFNVADYLR